MTPEEIARHMVRIQAAVLQGRGNPRLALMIASQALVPVQHALSSAEGRGTDEQLAAVRRMLDAIGTQQTACWLVTVLAIIGNGLQPPMGKPGDQPIGELE